jgi:curli biogenesis system outer membrane secretion channel CsgG
MLSNMKSALVSFTSGSLRRLRLSAVKAALGVSLVGLSVSVTVTGQSTRHDWTGPKMRIAVVNFSGTAFKEDVKKDRDTRTTTIALPPPADFAIGLTEMLTTELVKTGRFIVVERSNVKEVTGEQDFGASGRINKETAAGKGKIIGAQTLITGDITEFTYNQTSLGGKIKVLKTVQANADRVTAMVALDIRLIDATTGEVIFSKRSEGKSSMSGARAELTRGNSEFSLSKYQNTPLGHATREAITGVVAAIVDQIKTVPWSGRIIDVRDGMVYINAGAEQGMRPGMELDVYSQQEALVDPETGKALGTPDRKIGSLKVNQVEDKYCVAEATAGNGFQRNHLVRFKGQGQTP